MRNLAYKFDLQRLISFVAVCEEGSISAAATRLGVAQPALSASIRRLEHDIGTRLFERQARGVAVTEAGRQMLPRVYEIIGILRSLEDQLGRIDQTIRGEISVGLPPSAATVLTYPLLTHLAATYPHLSVRLVEAMSGYLHDWVANRELDLAITFDGEDTETIISQTLFRDEVMLIGATEMMRDLPNPYPIADLQKLPLVVTTSRHTLRRKVERHLESLGQSLNIRFEIDAGHQLVRMVRSGGGYGVFAQSAFYEELKAGQVQAIPFTPHYYRRVCLTHHRSKDADRTTTLVRAEIKAMTDKLLRDGGWPTSLPAD